MDIPLHSSASVRVLPFRPLQLPSFSRTVLVPATKRTLDATLRVKTGTGRWIVVSPRILRPCRIVISAVLIIRCRQADFRRVVFHTVTVPY